MARVTVEDCIDKVSNRFDLVLLAAQRAREISGGAELTVDRDRDKNPVVALREIAEQTVRPDNLKESLVTSLQRVLPDDDDAMDEVGSLSQSAEALRITAAAPTRNTSIGGDYDGMPTGPVGMEDVTGYPALFVELAKRGYSQADLEKISSRNMMRAMRAAEAYAESRKNMAPIEYPAGAARDEDG